MHRMPPWHGEVAGGRGNERGPRSDGDVVARLACPTLDMPLLSQKKLVDKEAMRERKDRMKIGAAF